MEKRDNMLDELNESRIEVHVEFTRMRNLAVKKKVKGIAEE